MKYIIRNSQNDIMLKLNDSPTYPYSGEFRWSCKHQQTQAIVTLVLTDESPYPISYQKFAISSGDSNNFQLGQYLVDVYDVTGGTIIQSFNLEAQDTANNDDVYFMANSNTAWVYDMGSTSIPDNPVNLVATLQASGTDVTLTYALGSTNTDSFEISRKTGSGGTWAVLNNTVQSLTYYDENLDVNTTFYYKIRAKNEIGFSEFSSEVDITTSISGTTGGTGVYLIGSGATTTTRVSGDTWNVYTNISGATVVWGGLTGDISTQTDLNNILTGQTEQIEINEEAIDTNYNLITGNTSQIDTNSQSIVDLIEDVGDNYDLITGNTEQINNNTDGITGNTTSILNKPDRSQIIGSGATTVSLSGNTVIVKSPIAGAATWGEIVGTLSNQTDLNSILTGHTQDITANSDAIAVNYAAITGNTAQIAINASGITDNYNLITGNTSLITGLRTDVNTNSGATITNANTISNLSSNFNSHSGDTSIHYPQSGITITQNQVTGLVNDLAGKTNTGTTAQIRTDLDTVSGITITNNNLITGNTEQININATGITANTEAINLVQAHSIEHIDNTQSAGMISGCTIVDDGVGGINIDDGLAYFKLTNDPIGDTDIFGITGVSGLTLTDNSINFIYVNYNGGTPSISSSTTSIANGRNLFNLGVVFKEGLKINILEAGLWVTELAKRVQQWITQTQGLAVHSSGAITSEVGTRNIAVTSGVWYAGLNRFVTNAFDTSLTDDFEYYYNDATGWIETDETQINNTQYNEYGVGLTTLSNNQYGVHWVYVGLGGGLFVIYGRDSYTITDAEAAQPPAELPQHVSSMGALAAKIIINKNATVFTEIQVAFDVAYNSNAATLHNDLAFIQGGDVHEYYHLTNEEYDLIPTITNKLPLSGGTLSGDIDFSSDGTTGGTFGHIGKHPDYNGMEVQGLDGLFLDSPAWVNTAWSGHSGSYLTVGQNGLINLTTPDTGATSWQETGTTEVVTANVALDLGLDVIPDDDVSAGSIEWRVPFQNTTQQSATVTLQLTVNDVAIGDGIQYVIPKTETTSIFGSSPVSVVINSGDTLDIRVTSTTDGNVESSLLRLNKSGSGGGSGTSSWGSIIGTLSDQTDLQSALDAKASTANFNTYTGTTAPATYASKLATINALTAATYTVLSGDTNEIIEVSNDCTVTLPTGLTSGFQVTFVNIGSSKTVTFSAGTGATLRSKDSAVTLTSQYGAVSAYWNGNNVTIIGDLN